MTIQIELNGEAFSIVREHTVDDLVNTLGLTGKPLAVAVNRRVVPRQKWVETPLAAGDQVDVVRAIGGG